LLIRTLHDPNEKLLEVALAADALRRAGAKRVTLIAPYLPYMRQDAVFRRGEAISQRVICGWLAHEFDGLLTLEPHLHRLASLGEYFPAAKSSISAAPIFAQWLRREPEPTLLVGPDEESEPWIRSIARWADCAWIVGRKRRLGDRKVVVELPDTGRFERALIVDDVASSGVTIAETARALRRYGIRSIDAGVVHAIFAPQSLRLIRAAGVGRVFSCDSIPHATNQLRCAPLFARAIAGSAR
jgi:ribose-phosphate pyrophosphokinase